MSKIQLMVKHLLVSLFVIFAAVTLKAQCITNVDFNDWKRTGDSTFAGNNGWQILAAGASLQSSQNTNFPRMFVGPDTLINVRITGTFRINDNADDDYVGFVFGFKETWNQAWWGTTTMVHEYYLFDWKKNTQNYIGYIAQEGFSLNKVDGAFQRTNPGVFPSFWSHVSSPQFDVLQTDFQATNGWVSFTDYDFELYYTPTRAVILIDSDTIFDQGGCFEPGLFGFYNYSQANAVYNNFNYELFVDYQIENQDVCLGDTAKFNFTDTSGCAGANAFSNLVSFYWDLGDGTISNDTNPRHVYQTADTFTVYLVATDINGCTDSSSKEIYIQDIPEAEFFAADVCLGDPMQFIDTTQMPIGFVTAWDWDFGDGTGNDTTENPSYSYQLAGTYAVQLAIETNAGCVDTVVENVTVLPNPVVNFSIDHACAGDSVHFVQDVDPAGAPLTNLFWDINNDGTQEYTGNAISHVFQNHGTFPVELIALNQNGCKDSVVINALSHPIPDVDFTAPGVCFNEVTPFTDATNLPYTLPVFWTWDFGDGNGTSYNLNNAPSPGPSHLYGSPGTKTISLSVTSDSGCVGNVTKQFEVYHLPVADFVHDTVCDNEITTLTQNSSTQSGFLSAYNWDFGDGNGSSSVSTSHDFLQPGLYEVTLAVITNLGCVDTVVKPVRVYPIPHTAFGWNNNVCQGEELNFHDQSSIQQITPGGDDIVSWEWVFNGGDTQYVQDPDFNTAGFGSVNVRLTTTSNYGCTTFRENTASVFPNPKADFSAFPACEDDTTTFNNRSSIAWGNIENWHWNYGDGSTGNGPNPGHPFQSPGSYAVTLLVTSANGCIDSITKEVVVPETPKAAFSVDPMIGCAPFRLSVENLSTIEEGGLSFNWYINDSLSDEGELPNLVLPNDTVIPVAYQIALTAFSDKGCPHTFILPNRVTVLPAPIADFTVSNPGDNPFESSISFSNNSKFGVRWLWNFGDGQQSDDFTPNHQYEKSGDYLAKQVVWNEYNCPDSLIKIVEVAPFTSLYIPSAFTPNGDGINERWFVKGFNEDKIFRIKVYNRWGELMAEGDAMTFSWDGTYPNSTNKAPIGTYVYHIDYMKSDGTEETVTGTFSLLN